MKTRGKHRADTPVQNGLTLGLRKLGFAALAGCAVASVGATPAAAVPEPINTERETSIQPVVQKSPVANVENIITNENPVNIDAILQRADITSEKAEPEPEPEPVDPSASTSSVGGGKHAAPEQQEEVVQDIWVSPMPHHGISSDYGYRDAIPAAGTSAGLHNGVDFGAPFGTDIAAASQGTVVHTGFSDFDTHTGGIVVIHHVTPHGEYLSSYNHMKTSDILVQVGDTVAAGEIIARIGSEGMSTGPHLHFTMREVTGSNPLEDWELLEPVAFFTERGIAL